MSNSKLHHPKLFWVSCKSNKSSRTIANRRLRHINKRLLSQDLFEECHVLKTLREVSNTYDFCSDGLSRWIGWDYFNRPISSWVSEDERYYRVWMR